MYLFFRLFIFYLFIYFPFIYSFIYLFKLEEVWNCPHAHLRRKTSRRGLHQIIGKIQNFCSYFDKKLCKSLLFTRKMAATALNRNKIEMEKRVPDGENTATFLEVTCLPRIFRWVYTKILSKQDFRKISCKCGKQQTIYEMEI